MGVKDDDGRYFKGAITQMGVYNVALSAQQILAVRNRGNAETMNKCFFLFSFLFSRDVELRHVHVWTGNVNSRPFPTKVNETVLVT